MNTITLEEISQTLDGKLGKYGSIDSNKAYFPKSRTDICAIVTRYYDRENIYWRTKTEKKEQRLYLFDKTKDSLQIIKVDSIFVSTDYEDDASDNSIEFGKIIEKENSIMLQYTKFYAASCIDRYRNQECEYFPETQQFLVKSY
jgi:hypothetical protein